MDNMSNVQQSQTQPVTKQPKQKAMALILCILGLFVGIHGLHDFYCGKIGMGIIKLLTLGFLGVGTIVDTVRIATGSYRDKEGNQLV